MSIEDAFDVVWAFVRRNPMASDFPEGVFDEAFEVVAVDQSNTRPTQQLEPRIDRQRRDGQCRRQAH